jgi:hypothetical protein
MDKCPACGSTKVYPSRHRSSRERLHQLFTTKRLYRCHACNWRQWASIEIHVPGQPEPDALVTGHRPGGGPMTPEELDRLDLPGADRIHAPSVEGRHPLPPESFDRLDPDPTK